MERRPNQLESHEKLPKFDDLTIFTSTFYGVDQASKVREALALKLFGNAERLNIRCIVIDGGSNEDFLVKARQYKNIQMRVEPSLGMGASRREALRIAAEEAAHAGSNHFYLWVEPEKDGLITIENLQRMIVPLRSGDTDIVVPARETMDTLPLFQAWLERRANNRAKGLLEEPPEETWDLWFGPKMFNAEGSDYFLKYNGELDKWDSIIKPVVEAYNDGKRISSVPVDYMYDESQKASEDGSRVFKQKRIEQYAEILAEMGDSFWKAKVEESKVRGADS